MFLNKSDYQRALCRRITAHHTLYPYHVDKEGNLLSQGVPEAFSHLLVQYWFGGDSLDDNREKLDALWQLISGTSLSYLQWPEDILRDLEGVPALQTANPLYFVSSLMPSLHRGHLKAVYAAFHEYLVASECVEIYPDGNRASPIDQDTLVAQLSIEDQDVFGQFFCFEALGHLTEAEASRDGMSFLTYIQRYHILSEDRQFLLNVAQALGMMTLANHLQPPCMLTDIAVQERYKSGYTQGELRRIGNFNQYAQRYIWAARRAYHQQYQGVTLLTVVEKLLVAMRAGARGGAHGDWRRDRDAAAETNEFLPVFQVIWNNLSTEHRTFLLTQDEKTFAGILNSLSPSVFRSISETEYDLAATTCLDIGVENVISFIDRNRKELIAQPLHEVMEINQQLCVEGYGEHVFVISPEQPKSEQVEEPASFPVFDFTAFDCGPSGYSTYISAADQFILYQTLESVPGISETSRRFLADVKNNIFHHNLHLADLLALLPKFDLEHVRALCSSRIMIKNTCNLADFHTFVDALSTCFIGQISDVSMYLLISNAFEDYTQRLTDEGATLFDAQYPYRKTPMDPHWTDFLMFLNEKGDLLIHVAEKRRSRQGYGVGSFRFLVQNWHDLLRLSCHVEMREATVSALQGRCNDAFEKEFDTQFIEIMNDEMSSLEQSPYWHTFLVFAMKCMSGLVASAVDIRHPAVMRYQAGMSQLTENGFRRFSQACIDFPEASGLHHDMASVIDQGGEPYLTGSNFLARMKPEHLDNPGIVTLLIDSVSRWKAGLFCLLEPMPLYYKHLFRLLSSRLDVTKGLFQSLLNDKHFQSNIWCHIATIMSVRSSQKLPNLGVRGAILSGLLSVAEGGIDEVWRVMHHVLDSVERPNLKSTYDSMRPALHYWYLYHRLGKQLSSKSEKLEWQRDSVLTSDPSLTAEDLVKSVFGTESFLDALQIAVGLVKNCPGPTRLSVIAFLSPYFPALGDISRQGANEIYRMLLLMVSVPDQVHCIRLMLGNPEESEWITHLSAPGPFADTFHLSAVYDQYYRAQSVFMCALLSACLPSVQPCYKPYIQVIWNNIDTDIRDHFISIAQWLARGVTNRSTFDVAPKFDLLRLFPLLWPTNHLERIKLMTPDYNRAEGVEAQIPLLQQSLVRIGLINYALLYICDRDVLKQFLSDCAPLLAGLLQNAGTDVGELEQQIYRDFASDCLKCFESIIRVRSHGVAFREHHEVVFSLLLQFPPEKITDRLLTVLLDQSSLEKAYGVIILLLVCLRTMLTEASFDINVIDWFQLCYHKGIANSLSQTNLKYAFVLLSKLSASASLTAVSKQDNISRLLISRILKSASLNARKHQPLKSACLGYLRMIDRILNIAEFSSMEVVSEQLANSCQTQRADKEALGIYLLGVGEPESVHYALFLGDRCQRAAMGAAHAGVQEYINNIPEID